MIRWDATEDHLLGSREAQSASAGRSSRLQQHPAAAQHQPAMQHHGRPLAEPAAAAGSTAADASSPGALPGAVQAGPPVPAAAALHGDAETDLQMRDSDLTQPDHPCVSSPLQGGTEGAPDQPQQVSSTSGHGHSHSGRSDQPAEASRPLDTGQSAPRHNAQFGIRPLFDPAGESELIQIEDESADDLLDFLADAAAADEQQQQHQDPGDIVFIDDESEQQQQQLDPHNADAPAAEASHQLQSNGLRSSSQRSGATELSHLEQPGSVLRTSNAAGGKGRGMADVWAEVDKDAQMLEAARAVRLNRPGGPLGAGHLQPLPPGLSGNPHLPLDRRQERGRRLGLLANRSPPCTFNQADRVTGVCKQVTIYLAALCCLQHRPESLQ